MGRVPVGSKQEAKVYKAMEPYRVLCKKCGHTLFIADGKHQEGKQICTHCGTMNYSKKRNFREEMMKRLENDNENNSE